MARLLLYPFALLAVIVLVPLVIIGDIAEWLGDKLLDWYGDQSLLDWYGDGSGGSQLVKRLRQWSRGA